jgi:glucans biosynthesis protein
MRRPPLFFGIISFLFASFLGAGADDIFERTRDKARELARGAYVSPRPPADSLLSLTYDESRLLQFRDEKTLYRNSPLPFAVQFLHVGPYLRNTIFFHEIVNGRDLPIPFDTNYFRYPPNKVLPADGMGFGGFRVYQSLGNAGEVAVFGGGAYFRMIGFGQYFGASARAVTVHVADSGREEFPLLKDFWFARPKEKDRSFQVTALLDGPSLSGAYQFTVTPGTTTVTRVHASLFFRKEISAIGLAPLTTMFKHGENSEHSYSDYRPEVHDSDGLQMQTGKGEWLWRPLDSGKMLRANSYQDENPRGFGLAQRDREFDHYEDLEALYHLRPTLWVIPRGEWGRGAVELFQLPTDNEYTDNVNVGWRPALARKAGESMDLDYDIQWSKALPAKHDVWPVISTRIHRINDKGKTNQMRFVVDFYAPTALKIPDTDLRSVATVSDAAKVIFTGVQLNAYDRSWRMNLLVEHLDSRRSFDLSAGIERSGKRLTETWIYTHQP